LSCYQQPQTAMLSKRRTPRACAPKHNHSQSLTVALPLLRDGPEHAIKPLARGHAWRT